MRLSIIIPSFQQAAVLQQALFSIRRQKFYDYEVIIMDAESKDDTAKIVEEFLDLNIQFYSALDHGIYDAMNKGVSRSTGEYLYFMGCDDKLASDTTLKQVFDNKNIIDEDFIYGDVIFTKDERLYDGKFGKLKLIDRNICHQAIFVKRKIFDEFGGFNIKYKYLADWDFNMKCFSSRDINIKYIPIIIAYYNNDGLSYNNRDVAFSNDREINKKKYFPLLIRYLDSHRNRLYRYLINHI